ncbi:hypothetical protein SH2C18_38500 [Clostridium sediminicola]|uniref:ester cyclase n=1 Tax=Clostridium sediminicola TaxID=3114879 RepID=UPI0031F26F31
MSATHLGNDWLGIPATGVEIDMRCIDWWRIEDGRAVENWVNLDIIHMLYQMGIDIFERVRTGCYHFKR